MKVQVALFRTVMWKAAAFQASKTTKNEERQISLQINVQ